jgi:predicted nucleic acid-binding protein
MLQSPDMTVIRWLDGQNPNLLWTTSITVFEIRFGLQRRADGRKTRMLNAAFDALISEDLGGRVAPVDRAAAEAAGALAAEREAVGRPVDFRDTIIAGIAIAQLQLEMHGTS